MKKIIISTLVALSLLIVGVLAHNTPVADAGNCQGPKYSGWVNNKHHEDGPASWWYSHDGGRNANGTYRPMSPACQPSGSGGPFPQGANCRNNFTCAVLGETDCVPSGITSYTVGSWNSCAGGSWNNCGTPPCSSPEDYDPLY